MISPSGRWRELSRYIPKRNIPEEVVAFIEKTQSPLCVACSGGSDSVALLLLIRLFWPMHTVIILHYNHRIRAVSDEEERKMVDLARQLEVKIEIGHRPVTAEIRHSSEVERFTRGASLCTESINPSVQTSLSSKTGTADETSEATPSEVLIPEHNIPHLYSASNSQTTGIIPKHSEAHTCTSDINLKHFSDTSDTTKISANQPLPFTPHPSLLKSDGSLIKIPSEAELREMRYAFFEKMLRLHNSNILLLGHHADDRLETVLMRLVRGVGLEGLVAPRILHKVSFYTKVRPLLNVSKENIRNALKQCEVSFFEDATNDEDDCLRNRIRHTLIPAFDTVLQTDWRKGFQCSCRLLSEQRDFFQQHLQKRFEDWDFSQKTVERSALQALSTVECRYFFQTWFQQHNIRNISTRTIDNILPTLSTKETRTLSLNAEHCLHICEKTVSLIPKNSPSKPKNITLLWRNGTLFFPNGARLSFKEEACTPECYQNTVSGALSHETTVALDAEIFTPPYKIRFWQNGDRYHPLGAKNTVKVKDLFINRKIPISEKHQRPVVCSANGEIAWIPGLPPADAFKLTPQTQRCVFLVYQPNKTFHTEGDGEKKDT